MALPKPEPESDPTIPVMIPASLHARVQDLASAQDRTPEELVIFLVRRALGDLTPAERREELVRRSEEERRANAVRPDDAEVRDPLAEIDRLAAEYFGDEESQRLLLHFIEHGTVDDID